LWYNEPATSILKNNKLVEGSTATTIDAFNTENGTIRYASAGEVTPGSIHITVGACSASLLSAACAPPWKVDQIIAHMKSFQPKTDYRDAVRKVRPRSVKPSGQEQPPRPPTLRCAAGPLTRAAALFSRAGRSRNL